MHYELFPWEAGVIQLLTLNTITKLYPVGGITTVFVQRSHFIYTLLLGQGRVCITQFALIIRVKKINKYMMSLPLTLQVEI